MYEETDEVNWECVDSEVGGLFLFVLVHKLRIEVLGPDAASRRAAKLFAIFHEVIALDLIVVVNCLLVMCLAPLSARDLRTNTIPCAPSTAHRIRAGCRSPASPQPDSVRRIRNNGPEHSIRDVCVSGRCSR